jgi:hypothetical protein
VILAVAPVLAVAALPAAAPLLAVVQQALDHVDRRVDDRLGRLGGVDADEPLGFGVEEPLVVRLHPAQERRLLELVGRAAPGRAGLGVHVEVERGVGRPGPRLVDPADVLQRALEVLLDADRLIGVPGVGVAVRDHDVPLRESGPDRLREVVGVVGGVEEEFRERVGVVVRDRAVDRLAVPRVGRFAGEDELGELLSQDLPDGRLAASVESLQRDEHTEWWGRQRKTVHDFRGSDGRLGRQHPDTDCHGS